MALSKMFNPKDEIEDEDDIDLEDDMEQEEEGEDLDNEIAFGLMANALLDGSGQQGIIEAVNQKNPVPVLASMIAALVVELAKRLEGSDMPIDQAVWLAPDGAVDRTIDFIDEVAGPLGEDVKTAILSDVVDQIKLFKQKGVPGSGGDAGAMPPPGAGGPPPQQSGGPTAPPPMGGAPMPMGGGF